MNSTEAAKPPPPGQVSNFVDPPSIQGVVIFALTLEIFISSVSVILRCYAQQSLFKKLVAADYCMLSGWISQIVFVALLYDCLPYGGGRHLWDVTKTNFAHIQLLLFIDYIIYGCAILGPKISILLQLINIFVPRGRNLSTSTRIFFWSAWAMIVINVVFYIPHNFLLIFQCNPIEKGWNPKLPGKCLQQFSLIESSAPFNIVSDILIFILPLSSISSLKLPLKTKLGTASAFAVGLFGVICSGVRLSYSDRLAKSGDITFLVFQNQLWANAEITVAILIANVIILPRFFRTRKKRRTSYYFSERTRSKSIGLQGGLGGNEGGILKSGQRDRHGDAYMELTESQTGTLRDERNSSVDKSSKDMDHGQYGITRTVEIESAEEHIQEPGRAITAAPRHNFMTTVTAHT